jgi:4-hydroxy-3-polyprenylbenzoate decarboxylase
MRKILVAVTGASGSIYARQLLDKFARIQEQWEAVAVVMTENAKEVWRTELGNTAWQDYSFPFFRSRISGLPLPQDQVNMTP